MTIDTERVSDSERITRYIVEKSKFSASIGRVKTSAFVPPANRRLSVYRTDNLQEPEKWRLGDEYVAPALGKAILARADLLAGEFTKRNLTVHPEPNPHERHCNVINWPESEWLKIATDLANAAQLLLVPRTG